QVSSRTIPAHRETLAVDCESGRLLFDPPDRACAILDRRRKLVLGSEPILDRYDSAVTRVRKLATYGVVRVAVADAEATSVHEYDRGQRSPAQSFLGISWPGPRAMRSRTCATAGGSGPSRWHDTR